MAVKLLVTLPSGKQGFIEVTKDFKLIGRSDECDLMLDDDRSSGKHCTVFLNYGRTYVKDEGSKNGTFVNGTRVREEVRIFLKDKILVGGTKLQLISEEMSPQEKNAHFKLKDGDSFTLPELSGTEVEDLGKIQSSSTAKEEVLKAEEDEIKKNMFKDLEDLTQKSIVKKIRVQTKSKKDES
ncbi:MAG: FHA domain-containing protein [Bacteriovoracaceae bacterium]|nr:FHA domain-containing protein [Bacteriovoracaceae bacterium]